MKFLLLSLFAIDVLNAADHDERCVPLDENTINWQVLVQSDNGMSIRREMVESVRCPIPIRWN